MILSGLMMGAAIVFPEVGLLAYVALLPLALAVFARIREGYGLRKAYLDGFIFFMSLGIVCFHWLLYFYPLDFVGLTNGQSLAVIFIGWLGLSLFQAVFSAFFFVILALLARTRICRERPYLIAVYAAVLFCVNEWTQSLTWAGVPWARFGISQTEMPLLMQSASLFGTYFLTFIIVLFNFLIVYALVDASRRKIFATAAICVFAANLAFGTVVCILPENGSENDTVRIAAIQGNLPSQTDDLTLSETLEIYYELTVSAAEDGATLVVWPENVIGTTLENMMVRTHDGTRKKLTVALSDIAEESGASIIVGHFTVLDESNIQNSLSVFLPDGTVLPCVYSKMRPVPFGEYLPMAELVKAILPLLGEINSFGYDTVPGEASTAFPCICGDCEVMVSTLICFDSIYDRLGIDSARAGAEILTVPSNDSWFYDSRALDMHHAQNILRAVEQGKYTVSIGNTGITSVVNGRGEVVDRIDIFTRDYIVSDVRPTSARTLYSYIGNSFVYICIAAVALPLIAHAVGAVKNKRNEKMNGNRSFKI